MSRAAVALALLAAAAGAGQVVPLWESAAPPSETLRPGPGEPPGGVIAAGRRTRVFAPWLEAFPAARPGASLVLVFPGGGYGLLAESHEGTEVAKELNRLGHAAAVVRYRVPARDPARPWIAPLADARRALALARSSATAWNADPGKVAVLGFSAGGNLVARLAYQAGPGEPRPDATILVYPAYLLDGSAPARLRAGPEGFAFGAASPPALLLHSEDDPIPVGGSLALAEALRSAGARVETRLWPDGGHGWGARGPLGRPWIADASAWLARQGLGPSR